MKAEDPTPRPPCPYVMIPVPKEDFKRVNELAEAYWIASDPDNKQAIKELRRNLLKKVNLASPPSSLVQCSDLSLFAAQQGSDRRPDGEGQRGQTGKQIN